MDMMGCWGPNTVRISTNEESTFVHACSQGAEPQNKACNNEPALSLQRAFGFALKRSLGLARWGSSRAARARKLGNLVALAARTAHQ
jgi:hypothetical protein